MPFMKSARNGLVVHITSRAVMSKLPLAFRSEQNGHLMKRDTATGDVLVQTSNAAPSSSDKFNGIPSLQAKKVLAEIMENNKQEEGKAENSKRSNAEDESFEE